MPYLETIPELVEDIADMCGVYGSPPEPIEGKLMEHPENCNCRICFTIDLEERIRQAVKNEKILARKGE